MIPTAEEILRKRYKLEGDRGELRIDNLVYIMNEYAKLHVKAALEVASKVTIPMIEENEWVGQYAEYFTLDRSNIEKAYPLENIK